jgi:Mg-chelatase subunit ChlD
MGFLDYAWSISFQKDNQKVKILQDPSIDQPTLEADNFGFTIKLPIVQTTPDGQFIYLGQKFPVNTQSKGKIGRLFRACVLHMTTHTLSPLPKEKTVPIKSDSITGAFAKSLIKDTFANAYLQAWYPDRFIDLAYASALAYQKIKPSQRIFAASTRVMSAILTKTNIGSVKGNLSLEEEQTVNAICAELTFVKDTFLSTLAGEQVNLDALFDEKAKTIINLLEPFGPFLEAPSLRHTEQIGRCSIYTEAEIPTEDVEGLFVQSLEALGGSVPAVDNIEQCWRPEQESEALQAFNSDQNQMERREKILVKISPYVAFTRFKSVGFPDEDYTQYLRAKSLVQGTSRRLLDALRSALNYLDEDPRQEMGQLDLSAVIQAMASNKPATDVFVLDEYLKQSFAWSIIVDVSSSMQVKGDYGRALAIAVAEAAKELMMDTTSWTLFGFSDRLFILKANSESYSQRVKARIGGLRFEGLTYIPDAVHMAGKMLAKRFEEQRILVVISDGWPYGYPNMPIALKENVDDLLKKGVIVIGIGVETDRMGNFFRLNSSIYTPKDLLKKFANVYIEASAKALES